MSALTVRTLLEKLNALVINSSASGAQNEVLDMPIIEEVEPDDGILCKVFDVAIIEYDFNAESGKGVIIR